MTFKILFASVRNAGRTQIAAAWFNALAHPDKASAISAGTNPALAVHERVRAAMKHVGVDISSEPMLLTPLLISAADLVIVIGPPLPTPTVQGAREHDEWIVEDAAGATRDRTREIAHEIERLVRNLVVTRHWMPLGASMPPIM